ncbi:unnamed protein product [Dovyalis caffra]|uniref:Uncharacterized protein n=1 Tax=Dovyalis caffra TaxID=77055 RepID=A0AAV1RIC3_9ROSI|nr:unnamed protein product [Dovyalis caffra]
MGVSSLPSPAFLGVFLFSFVTLALHPEPAFAITRHYKLDYMMQNGTRLCLTKSMVTVNGKFPEPRIIAREGDGLLIEVSNHESGSMQIQRQSLTRYCKQVEAQLYLMLTPSMDYQGHYITALSKVQYDSKLGLLLQHRASLSLSFTLCKWYLADTFKLKVNPGKTYLLRLINAALNDELFFSI